MKSLIDKVSFFQLTFNNKRKPERSLLCEDFIERTSRPHEVINPEVLEVRANGCDTLTGSVRSGPTLTSCPWTCRSCWTSTRSTARWKLPSPRLPNRPSRPSTSCARTSCRTSTQQWWTSTSGSTGRWDASAKRFDFCPTCVVSCWGFDELPCLVRKRLVITLKTTTTTTARERRHSRRSVQPSRCSCRMCITVITIILSISLPITLSIIDTRPKSKKIHWTKQKVLYIVLHNWFDLQCNHSSSVLFFNIVF